MHLRNKIKTCNGGSNLRTKVGDIAKLANCSHHFVRRFADRGYIRSVRDVNGWRIFPHPTQAVETIQHLLRHVDEATETSGTTDIVPNVPNRCD